MFFKVIPPLATEFEQSSTTKMIKDFDHWLFCEENQATKQISWKVQLSNLFARPFSVLTECLTDFFNTAGLRYHWELFLMKNAFAKFFNHLLLRSNGECCIISRRSFVSSHGYGVRKHTISENHWMLNFILYLDSCHLVTYDFKQSWECLVSPWLYSHVVIHEPLIDGGKCDLGTYRIPWHKIQDNTEEFFLNLASWPIQLQWSMFSHILIISIYSQCLRSWAYTLVFTNYRLAVLYWSINSFPLDKERFTNNFNW